MSRASGRSYSPLEWAGWLATAREVLADRRPASIPILAAMLEAPGAALSHERVLEIAGSDTTQGANRLSAAHVGRLKRALADIGFDGCIVSLPGAGYVMRKDAAPNILEFIESIADPRLPHSTANVPPVENEGFTAAPR